MKSSSSQSGTVAADVTIQATETVVDIIATVGR